MSSKRIGLPGRPRREAPNYRINGWMYSLSLAAAVAAFALILSFDIDVSRPLAKLSDELSYAFRPLTDSPSDDQIAAPLLVGRLLPEARATAAGRGLQLVVAEVVDENSEPGLVIDQNPVAGILLSPGQGIAIQVAESGVQTGIGSFVGQSVELAQAQLTGQGFAVETVATHQSNLPVGVVSAQFPDPGTPIAAGSEITLIYNAGIRLLTVPDLAGLPVAVAERRAAAAGFSASRSESDEYLPSMAVGTVVSQAPVAGTVLAPDQPIALFINQPPQVIVPDLLGLELVTARALAARSGLVIGRVINPPPRPDRAVEVRVQSPQPGHTVRSGTTIAVVVGYRAEG